MYGNADWWLAARVATLSTRGLIIYSIENESIMTLDEFSQPTTLGLCSKLALLGGERETKGNMGIEVRNFCINMHRSQMRRGGNLCRGQNISSSSSSRGKLL